MAERRPPGADESRRRVLRLPHGKGRQALLEAVVRVVAREGFDGLTYRAVAAEAGVTHGLVHYHFGSRDAMVAETLRWAIEEAMESSIDTFAEAGEIDSFGEGLSALISSHPDAQTFQNELLLAACRRPDLRPHMDVLFRTYWEGIARALARGGIEPTPALVRLVFAAMNGLVLQQLYFDSVSWTDEAIEELQHALRLRKEESTT
jgi:AcrR family transcriptional regulator